MTTFIWNISQLNSAPEEGSYTDVVLVAHWSCSGYDNSNYKGYVYGSCSFPSPESGGTFIPYADLTQDDVLSWCWANGVNKDATETAVQQQIDYQINPPVVTLPLPWA